MPTHASPGARALARWGPAFVMMALIFAASSIPGDTLPGAGDWDFTFKKGGHVLGYALLGLALLRGLAFGRPARVEDAARAVVLAALYGVTDEVHQIFTPGRGPSAVDVLIDTAGAVAGLLACRYAASNCTVKWLEEASPSDTTK